MSEDSFVSKPPKGWIPSDINVSFDGPGLSFSIDDGSGELVNLILDYRSVDAIIKAYFEYRSINPPESDADNWPDSWAKMMIDSFAEYFCIHCGDRLSGIRKQCFCMADD